MLQTMPLESSRVEALQAILPLLADHLLSEVYESVASVGPEWERAIILGALASHLPTEDQLGVFQEA